jgi:hypothetical protein
MSSHDPRGDVLRDLVRDVVRDVLREVIAEELAGAALVPNGTRAAGSGHPTKRPVAHGTGEVISRGAVTERQVRAAGKSGRLLIAKGVVVTPLAKERAKAMGVDIVRIDG